MARGILGSNRTVGKVTRLRVGRYDACKETHKNMDDEHVGYSFHINAQVLNFERLRFFFDAFIARQAHRRAISAPP